MLILWLVLSTRVMAGESVCVVEYSGAGEALSSLSPSDALVVNLMQYTVRRASRGWRRRWE